MGRLTTGCVMFLMLAGPGSTALHAAQGGDAIPDDRQVSAKQIPANVLSDQKHIWEFPTRLHRKRVWIPTLLVLGATAGLVAADSHTAPYFRKTTSFSEFNEVFSSNATAIGLGMIPVAMYVSGVASHDSRLSHTALLAAEAMGGSEILSVVLKEATRRVRPVNVPLNGNYADTFYEGHGTSFPSGHAIIAFSGATVIARRYGRDHKWVPYAAYGVAALVGFSRVTLSAHYVSDVFLGGALGYSVGRFSVLRQ